jgi:hypothetical protein
MSHREPGSGPEELDSGLRDELDKDSVRSRQNTCTCAEFTLCITTSQILYVRITIASGLIVKGNVLQSSSNQWKRDNEKKESEGGGEDSTRPRFMAGGMHDS